MCALLPAWLCLLLGVLPLETRSLHSPSNTHRFGLPRTSKNPKSYTDTLPAPSDLPVAMDNRIPQRDEQIIWKSGVHREPQLRSADLLLDPSDGETASWPRRSRGRRHANSSGGRGHGHLMRVGCVLGTCQVQNLSHRLYQLIGQSGREDSSPINPRSPHSYG